MDVRGMSAVVTGASRGLGEALARALAERGARVVLVARGNEELEGVVRDIRARGGEAHYLVADVGQKDDVYRIAGVAAELVGPIDILVHNASTLGKVPLSILLDTDCEDMERVFAVNVIGPFRLTKAIAGPMVLRGRGLVVQISSDAAVLAYPRWGAYGISKAALDHLGRILAEELRGTGVRVLTVDPGEMNTRMHADAIPDADKESLAAPEQIAARIVSMIERSEQIESGARISAQGAEVFK